MVKNSETEEEKQNLVKVILCNFVLLIYKIGLKGQTWRSFTKNEGTRVKEEEDRLMWETVKLGHKVKVYIL